MASVLSADASPFTQAIQLTHDAQGEAVAVAVGALLGVAIFVLAVALASRQRSRLRLALPSAATDVVFVPPYRVLPTRTRAPSSPMRVASTRTAEPAAYPPPRVFAPPSPFGGRPFAPEFRPSTELSARAFAKMGFAFGERLEDGARTESDTGAPAQQPASAVETGPASVVEMRAASPVETGPASAVTVRPILSVGAAPAPRSDESSPSPLAIIRRSSSSIMAAAPIAELDLDDGPTELGEPFFDVDAGLPAPVVEPLQPCHRGAAPKIRPIAPTPPRCAHP
ncbi:MAG: hypothetical protein KF795_29715 [Labilithrix sp.]|nr:hypothetical protein [Labilithrix sp.]